MSSNKNRPSPPRLIVNPPTPDFQSQFQSPGLFSSSSSSSSSFSETWSLSTATTVTPTTQLPQQQPTLTIETLIAHLRTPLHPLVSSITGLQHPYFPRTLLSYHLLTSHQLDDLARHYHQVWPPVPGTFWYPASIPAWVDHDGRECRNGRNAVDLVTKRRRFGRFIGLRGCESPVDAGEKKEDGLGNGNGNGNDQGEDMVRRMEMEWQMALERAVGEDPGAVVRSKW